MTIQDGDSGGDGGFGGYGGDGGSGDGGGVTPPSQQWWMDRQLREDNFYSAAGNRSPEVYNSPNYVQEFLSGTWNVVDTVLGISDTRNAINTLSDPNSGTWDRAGAVGRIFLNVGSDILMVTGVGEVVKGSYLAVKGGLYLAEAATTKEVNIETEITRPSLPSGTSDPYASYGENGNLEGHIYDGAASTRVTATQGTRDVVHGNSKLSAAINHGYEISEKETGDVVKTGISKQPLNKDGTSPRANSQVNRWNNEAGYGKYEAQVVQKNIPGRQAALDWEEANAQRLWDEGNSMSRHQRPTPWK